MIQSKRDGDYDVVAHARSVVEVRHKCDVHAPDGTWVAVADYQDQKTGARHHLVCQGDQVSVSTRGSQGRIIRRIYSFNSSFVIRRRSLYETSTWGLVKSGLFSPFFAHLKAMKTNFFSK